MKTKENKDLTLQGNNSPKVQLGLDQLEHLIDEPSLGRHFLTAIKEDGIKAPMAYQIAKMMNKQTKLEV